jgi:predicted PurR-regulated permease PerM
MLGIDWRAARVTWTVFLFVLGLLVLYLAREAILIFVAAFLLAYMLTPMLNFVCRFTPPHVSRTAALGVVYVIVLAVIGLLFSWIGSQLVQETTTLAQRLPDYLRNHNVADIPLPSWLEPARLRLLEALHSQLDSLTEKALPLLQKAVGGVLGVASSLLFVVLVPILAFLFLKDAEEIRRSLLSWVPAHRRAMVDSVAEDIHVMLVQYIRAIVILSAATGVIYIIFFSIIGLPYSVLLSMLAAPLEFIPVFGPLTAALIIIGIAIITGYPHVWWIIVFFLAYRMFQDYVLQPYLMSSGVELHPLLVLFGALAGESLGGLWGMFLSVPVLAILRIVIVRVMRAQRSKLEPVTNAPAQ